MEYSLPFRGGKSFQRLSGNISSNTSFGGSQKDVKVPRWDRESSLSFSFFYVAEKTSQKKPKARKSSRSKSRVNIQSAARARLLLCVLVNLLKLLKNFLSLTLALVRGGITPPPFPFPFSPPLRGDRY